MKPSRIEQETIINFSKAEPTAAIYTHNPTLRRKLEQLCDQRPDDAKRGGVQKLIERFQGIPAPFFKQNADPSKIST